MASFAVFILGAIYVEEYLPEDISKYMPYEVSELPAIQSICTSTTLKGSLPKIIEACEDCFNPYTCILLCPSVQVRFIEKVKLSQPKWPTKCKYSKHDQIAGFQKKNLYILGACTFASTANVDTYLFSRNKQTIRLGKIKPCWVAQVLINKIEAVCAGLPRVAPTIFESAPLIK